MSSQINNRLKPIKIKITYNSKSFNIDVQPYKTIKYVKEQAKKHFFSIKNTPLSLLYQNKDLTQYESYLLGEYFKYKSTVCLRLIPSSSIPATLLQSCSENRLQLITEPNIDRYSHSQKQYTCYYDKEIISYYCRSCCNFICSSCKMSDNHINHSTVHVDVNKMEDSIRLYALTLQNDIHINMQSIKSNDANGGSNTNTIYLDHYHTKVNAKEEAVLNKIDSLMTAYKEMSDILSMHAQNYYYQYDELIADFNKAAKEENEDLEQFIVNLYKTHSQEKSKVSYNEMISLFKFIQNKENDFNEKTKDALVFKINQELEANITAMFHKLEEIINEYSNNSPSPFGLSTNSYQIYSLIKSKCITRNDNRRKTTKKSQFMIKANNDYSTFKREVSNSKNKYSITAVDKDDRSKSNDSHYHNNNSNSNNNYSNNHNNSKKKIAFNENFEDQISIDKKAEISFTNKEIRKPNLLSRVYTKDTNAHNITQFFNGGKSRTPIKYMTHKITDKDKSVSEYSSFNKEHHSIAESNAEYNIKRRKNVSIASIKEIDNIFDIDNTSKFGNNNY